MPERLVRQRRGLVYFQRVAAPQRAEHAAVLLLRRAHFTTLRHDVPGVARDGRARRLREGLSCCSREDGEHRCSVAATASANWCCGEQLFLWSALRGSVVAANGCALVTGRRSPLWTAPIDAKPSLSFASRLNAMGCCAAQAGLGRAVAPHSSVPGRLAEHQTRKTHPKTGSHRAA